MKKMVTHVTRADNLMSVRSEKSVVNLRGRYSKHLTTSFVYSLREIQQGLA
jgi:hypothetical protein